MRRKSKSIECDFCKKIISIQFNVFKKSKLHHCSNKCRGLSRRKPYLDKSGYRVILVDTEQGAKQVLEHRFIMETILGRKLERWETVHHKNGDRADNRPENLELFASRHCTGQRIRDLRAYLRTIPKRLGGLK